MTAPNEFRSRQMSAGQGAESSWVRSTGVTSKEGGAVSLAITVLGTTSDAVLHESGLLLVGWLVSLTNQGQTPA